MLAAGVLATAIAGGLLFANLSIPSPSAAAIVDQLSLTVPNADFVASATRLLEQAGYAVDYYSGEQVTVDFYRNLPTLDYELIILRVHSGMARELGATFGDTREMGFVALFTGEAYREDKYLKERKKGLVGRATYYVGAPPVFAIGSHFVEESMRGRFNQTIIILTGCEGLKSQRTAQAFLNKGAQAFVGWTDMVSASHTDAATKRLLEKLLVEGLTVENAVAQTTAEVGPEPSSGAQLRVLLDNQTHLDQK